MCLLGLLLGGLFLTLSFEPMGTGDMRHVMMRALFLIALATTKRVGELQTLLATVACPGEDQILSYLPEFVAKTETQLYPLPTEFLVLLGVTGH